MAKPLVALVGRPNVGKSTIFNRVIGERVAIVEDIAGTTRDRLYYEAEWNGRSFTIIDTGGMELQPGDDIGQRVRHQAEAAIAEADVILFVVDARTGPTTGDDEVAKILRQSSKPVIVVANKADTVREQQNAAEFYKLGLSELYSISAMHGTGTGDLLDSVVNHLPPPEPEQAEDESTVRVAIVGRPNVGKSSLLNAIAGQERSIVSDVPGTTRDAIDTEVMYDGHRVVLVDTAGMRRRGKIDRGIEQYSVLRAVRAIERADVVVLVIDGSEGVTAQDTHLAGFAISESKGLVFVVNKWDLLPRTPEVYAEFTAQVREDFKFAPFAPLLFVSAQQRWHVDEVMKTVLHIADTRKTRIPTATFNALIAEAVDAHGPSMDRGRTLRILYATQVAINPPTFVFFVNDSSLLHFSYRRYLENRIRQAFGFEGTAIKLIFRPREERQIERAEALDLPRRSDSQSRDARGGR